jgi:hypothetical protein
MASAAQPGAMFNDPTLDGAALHVHNAAHMRDADLH